MSDRISKKTIPYYICAPSYTSKSAGVVTLYRLCHYLNESGLRAWINPLAEAYNKPLINPYLNTPMLTEDIHAFHVKEGIDPIFVYPDIVMGNPYLAKRVVWFLLHYPGVYGGQPTFTDTDRVWSFSPHIASFTPKPQNVLSAPNIDLDLFKLPPEGSQRKGACYYANKYINDGNKLPPGMGESTKLEGTHEQIAFLLQRSEVCYVYENTSVISEAVLCGCNVVLIRSSYFLDIHSLETQTGKAGVRWFDQPENMEPLENAKKNYGSMCEKFFNEQLPRFVEESQRW